MGKKILNFSIIAILLCIIIGYIVLRTLVYPIKYKEEVLKYANENSLDPYLVLAIINTESGFDADATSSKDACGLMQITLTTAEEINIETNSTEEINEYTIYDVDVNLEIGCKYLASLIKRYDGNYYLAICAYNAGIGNVNSWIEDGKVSKKLNTTDIELPFLETTNYLKKVIRAYKIYKLMYPVL